MDPVLCNNCSDKGKENTTDVIVKMHLPDFTLNNNPTFDVDPQTRCEVLETHRNDVHTARHSDNKAGIIICLLRLLRLVPDGLGICSGGRDHLFYPFLVAISLVLTITSIIFELAGWHLWSLALLCAGCGISWGSTPLNMIVPQLSKQAEASGDSASRYESLKASLNRGQAAAIVTLAKNVIATREPSPEVSINVQPPHLASDSVSPQRRISTVEEIAVSIPTYVWSCFMTNLMMEFILGVSVVYFSLTWESKLGAAGIMASSVIPTASLATYAFVELVAWKRLPEFVQGWSVFRTPMSHFLPPAFTLLLWMIMGLQGSLAIIGCAHFFTCFVDESVQRSAQVNMGTLLTLRPGTDYIAAIREALNTITGAIGGTLGMTLYAQLGQQGMAFSISGCMCTMIVLQLVLAAVHYNQYILKLENMLEIYEDRMSEIVLKEEPSEIKTARVAKRNKMASIFTSQQAMDHIEAKIKLLSG
ncbi:hypothetical protein CYMTET_5737 [Cymbomonas tetramitiformis]|uniref:Uncharacterized protein n=1 Tax=Cymbomonas tetramitiformis TaxID=36881 RepID=A0AAE0GYU9_9CHLO|nr:hypothetical protein CYMTET_5737 [Cymbomonas tetramitiformis]